MDMIRPYDSTITEDRCLMLDIRTDTLYELPTMLVWLSLIWGNRVIKKRSSANQATAEVVSLVSLIRRSRNRKLREAAIMIENSLNNFV